MHPPTQAGGFLALFCKHGRVPAPHGPPQRDLAALEPLHEQVVALLGPYCEKLYKLDG